MNSTDLYQLFRADTTDVVAPFLWSDLEVYTYMNDAYSMFVRRIGGIPEMYNDDTCLVKASAGVETTTLHPKVLFIREAFIDPTGEIVKVLNMQDTAWLQREDYGQVRYLVTSKQPGKVRYLVIGVQDDFVKWVQIPDQDYMVRLLIERLPLDDITGAGQDFADVKDHHHLYFLCWMKYLAYNKQDADTLNTTKAAEEQAKFMAYCAFARQEKEQYKHKVRVVRYGGI